MNMQMWYTMVYAILYVDVGKCGHFWLIKRIIIIINKENK